MRIDFHFNVEHRLHHACRVVRKARAAGKTVLAYARNADRLARLDAALWTFSALDFVPHVYADSPLAARTPVLLTLRPPASGLARDVLVYLDDDLDPDFAGWFGNFERVIEVVSCDEADRAHARARWRTYCDRGFTPQKHDMASA
jgi:DNA polymerase-3 subunit chi